MAISVFDNLLGEFAGEAVDHSVTTPLGNAAKVRLAVVALAGYAIARVGFGVVGLPAEPHYSSLLLLGQPFYAVFLAGIGFLLLTLAGKPLVAGVRFEAPVFVAAIALLALPTHGGDIRNALLDSGSATVFLRMGVELALLSVAVVVAYVLLGRTAARGAPVETIVALRPAHDTASDRATAVGLQALLVVAMMSFLGQGPLKGQAMCGLALAGGLSAWVTHKTRDVAGSIWPVLGTLLAGIAAYAWSFLHPDGLALGDIRNSLAGAASSLPLHYATAGVAGTIYGYWVARASSPADLAG